MQPIVALYALDAYRIDTSRHTKSRKPTVYYAPMGSGKTHLLKHLISGHPDYLVIAPYRSCRNDLDLEYEPFNGLHSPFLYPGDVIQDFVTKSGLDQNESVPSKGELIVLVREWLKTYGPGMFNQSQSKLIILDEIDFMFGQFRWEYIELKSGIRLPASLFWEVVLRAISVVNNVIGFTATKVPFEKYSINEVFLKCSTTVRLEDMNIHLYNNVRSSRIVSNVLKSLPDQDVPTLFYKRVWTTADKKAIMSYVLKRGKTPLFILRKSNAAKIDEADALERIFLAEFGYNIFTDDVTLSARPLHFALVDSGKADLDIVCDGNDAFSKYNYVFINTSSSRQVSIRRQSVTRCKAVCFGSSLDATMIQVCARFRDNPVEFEAHLHNRTCNDLRFFIGQGAVDTFKKHDPFFKEYGLLPENCNCEYHGNLGVTKGKAVSNATALRRSLLQKFLELNTSGSRNQRFKQYQQWIKTKHPATKPYSIKAFYKAAQEEFA